MKYYIKTIVIAALALASYPLARANIVTVSNDVNVATWDAVGGNTPFYTTSLAGLSAQGYPSSGSGPFVVLSETFTVTNGGGGLSAAGASSNYMLNAISLIAGSGSGPVQVHLYDVTTNLTSNNGTVLNGSGATYNFVANGDLLGFGNGLTFSNSLPGERQQVLVLGNGQLGADQVILGTNHTYALEFWVPKAASGILTWYRSANADPGGQAMGSHDGSLGVGRLSIASLGLAGAAPRTFGVALYGTPTSLPLNANNNTNPPIVTTNYVVDDFSVNGVSPANPQGYDFFATSNIYSAGGFITNVWANWFGGGLVNSNIFWTPNDANGNPASGSMQLNLNPGTGGQWVLHHVNYPNYPGVSSITYTAMVVDVRWDPSSAVGTGTQVTNSNFGPLRFGVRPNGAFNQDWFFTTNIFATNTGWVHLVIPLALTDNNLSTGYGEPLIGMDPTIGGWSTNGTGPQILYVDNVGFIGSVTAPPVPPPTVAISPARPGLRIYAGSTVNTFDRASITTVSENESWIGGSYPVTYSFSLLSYPNNNINQTMVEIMPVNPSPNTPLGGTYPAAGNQFFDFQDPMGMWLVLAPNGGGRVTATVEWKVGQTNANPNVTALVFTNPTALGTWTWTFNSPSNGTVSAPGGLVEPFVIGDTNVSADFANPALACFGLQPNSSAGFGLFEDWGMTSIHGTAGGDVSDDWTTQTTDFNPNGGLSFDGLWSPQGSANPQEIIISRKGLDAYWVTWTVPAPVNFGVVASTNLFAPLNGWTDVAWFGNNADFFPPRANASVLMGPIFLTLIPYSSLPTVNHTQQPSAPNVTVPLAPNAFFIGTTNFNNQFQ